MSNYEPNKSLKFTEAIVDEVDVDVVVLVELAVLVVVVLVLEEDVTKLKSYVVRNG